MKKLTLTVLAVILTAFVISTVQVSANTATAQKTSDRLDHCPCTI